MTNKDEMNQKSNIVIYKTEDGLAKIETTFDEDTVWLRTGRLLWNVGRNRCRVGICWKVTGRRSS